MKFKLLLGCFAFIAFQQTFSQEVLSTKQILNNAYTQAKEENKNVMVIFHASWCGWCKKMDQQMNDESVKSFFEDNYVIEHLVVLEAKDKKHLENEGSLELLKKYNADKSGIPFYLIFDKKGEFLADSFDENKENIGCPASKEEVAEFIKDLKVTSKLNDDQLKIVENIFLKK